MVEVMNRVRASKTLQNCVVILFGIIFLVGVPDITPAVLAENESIPGLKPMTPKVDKIEPYKAGIEHNKYLEKKAKKKPKKKAKPKKLKSQADKNQFQGRSLFGSKLDNQNLNSSLDSNFLQSQTTRGIGIIGVKFIAYPSQPPVINQVFPGTPAHKAGLLPLDVIVAVDGVPTSGLTKEECYDLIVGTPNTPVTLSIRRGPSFTVYTMTRMDHTELTNPRVGKAYGVQL